MKHTKYYVILILTIISFAEILFMFIQYSRYIPEDLGLKLMPYGIYITVFTPIILANRKTITSESVKGIKNLLMFLWVIFSFGIAIYHTITMGSIANKLFIYPENLYFLFLIFEVQFPFLFSHLLLGKKFVKKNGYFGL